VSVTAPVSRSLGLVGRDRELRELEAGLTAAAAGSGQAFVLVGEAGIGKTILAREVANRAQ